MRGNEVRTLTTIRGQEEAHQNNHHECSTGKYNVVNEVQSSSVYDESEGSDGVGGRTTWVLDGLAVCVHVQDVPLR